MEAGESSLPARGSGAAAPAPEGAELTVVLAMGAPAPASGARRLFSPELMRGAIESSRAALQALRARKDCRRRPRQSWKMPERPINGRWSEHNKQASNKSAHSSAHARAHARRPMHHRSSSRRRAATCSVRPQPLLTASTLAPLHNARGRSHKCQHRAASEALIGGANCQPVGDWRN